MKKETIPQNQAISIVVMFVIGTSLTLGISNVAKQDSWIALIIGIAAVMPLIWLYSRILGRFPGKSFFEISTEVFGKVLGKIVIAFYIWYAFHLGTMVLRNFSEFVQVRVFQQMPQTFSLLCLLVLVAWVCHSGVETLGRWCAVVLPFVVLIILGITALLIKDMHPVNLLPVGENLDKLPMTAFEDFSFPFAETVLFLGVLSVLNPGRSPGKSWLWGILIAGGLLLLSLLRNMMVLGFPMETDKWFPSYDAASIIIAGSFISRIENIAAVNLLLGCFVKAAVCLLFTAKGLAGILNQGDYRPYVVPLGLLMAAFACTIYSNTMDMFAFLEVYPYYTFPFQVALPLLLCIVAEIRFLLQNRKKKENGGEESAEPAG